MSKPDVSASAPIEEDPVGGMISASFWCLIFLLSVVVNGVDAIQGDGNWWDLLAVYLSGALFAYSIRQFIRARRMARSRPPTPRLW